MTFGKMSVLKEDMVRGTSERTRWICRCQCGAEKSFLTQNLTNGTARSCGVGSCHMNTKHHDRAKRAPEYAAWVAMKQRCLNKRCWSYRNWGGRGIKIFKAWVNDYCRFLKDVGRRPSSRHSLGRIDNSGNYEPQNVRWETMSQQSNNQRTNRPFTFGGETLTGAQWSRRIGANRNLVGTRIRNWGWSVKEAVTTPPFRPKGLKKAHAEHHPRA